MCGGARALPLLLSLLLLSGCAAMGPAVGPAGVGQVAESAPALWAGTSSGDAMGGKAAPPAIPVNRGTPVTDENFPDLVSKYRPNELGRVLVLEYHDFKNVEERWARRWDNFRKDLETLYAKGYRAVNLLDYLGSNMSLPAGTSPVIFTFDDGLESQVKLIQRDGKWEADPESAVGLMLQFQREHPDFGAAGTFYVNFTPAPFHDVGTWQAKIRFLTEHGFEVANHSLYHDDLSSLTSEGVLESLGEQVLHMREVLPEYDGSTLALPFGIWPEDQDLAIHGTYKGVTYKHRAVLLVGSDPVYSPYDKRLDVMALPRVQAIDSEFERWLPFLDDYRYISDGDPATVVIPNDMADKLNQTAVQGKQVRTYEAAN
jgi:peptidoglycan/xylan/chitin deacetylase (PgdA/CDA1 family)